MTQAAAMPASSMQSAVLRRWRRLNALPLGRRLFNRMVGFTVPYAASIRPDILTIEPGLAQARIHDRRFVRNHLRSIHAVALINLAEMTANLAMMSVQPRDGRWIVTGLDTEFVKKARGPVTAECRIGELDWSRSQDVTGEVALRDQAGDVVMIARPRWRIGPVAASPRRPA